MGYSHDSSPHVGQIPVKPGQYICAGFNGHGMPVIFLAAKGLAQMLHGQEFAQVNLPRIFQTTTDRLQAAQRSPGGDTF